MEYIAENAATIVVGAFVFLSVALAVRKMARDKKNNKGSCGCGSCGGCPSADACRPK